MRTSFWIVSFWKKVKTPNTLIIWQNWPSDSKGLNTKVIHPEDCAFMLSTDGFTCVNFSSYFMLSSLRWEMEGWHFLCIFTGKPWAEIITSMICLMTAQWGKMNDDGPWHLYFGWERKRVCPGREKKYLIKRKSCWIRQCSHV